MPDSQNSNQFFVFHLMGTHGGYNMRYPNTFERFNHQSLKHTGLDSLALFWEQMPASSSPAVNLTPLTETQSALKAQYLNAVLYNDFVVSEIIKRFEEKEAIIFYLSDHGDEVYDFRDFVGHSFSMVSRYMVEVPFVIYVSDSLKKSHPHLVERITQAQNLPFMSDDFCILFSICLKSK
ncbi:sulfatase-like hydrolase/transferase [Helicobacter himalayensis]|uniref:sulfatase-like hydrolase/transferase n=1 Tax=Helicobacter himalayensis TaxID=1591088 RepID=UPI003D6FF69D